MEIRYQFFEEEKLLVQKFYALFSPEFYFKNIGGLFEKLKGKEIRKVIIDFRDVTIYGADDNVPDDFEEKLNSIIKFRKKINKNVLLDKKILMVMWVNNPLPTVIAHIFTSSFSEMDYYYCSSEEKVKIIADINPDFNLSEKVRNLNCSI
jgi:hypothetical protein